MSTLEKSVSALGLHLSDEAEPNETLKDPRSTIREGTQYVCIVRTRLKEQVYYYESS
jgi:hypothetical protein